MAVQQLVLFYLGIVFVILGGFLMFYESLRRTMRSGPTLYKAAGTGEGPKKDSLAQILDSFAGVVTVMDKYLGKTNQSSKAGLLLVVLGFAMILGSFYLPQ